jgi:hypothetical protein
MGISSYIIINPFFSNSVWAFGCGVRGLRLLSISESLLPSNFLFHLDKEDLGRK